MENEFTATVQTTSAPETAPTDPKTDYKALYEAAVADNAAKKSRIEAVEKSLKEYKDKEEAARKAALPPEKKAEEEIDERDKVIASLMAKLNRNDVDRVFSEKGYKEDQYKGICDLICSSALFDPEKQGEHRVALANKFVELLASEKARIEQSESIGSVRGGSQPLSQGGTAKESAYAKWSTERSALSSKKVTL